MKYQRTLLKTLAILGPMAVALSAFTTGPAQAYDWCYDHYAPDCAYPYAYAYGDPFGGSFFFFDDRRDHHFDDRFHHRFDHDGFRHRGFHHGGFSHREMGHGIFSHGGGRGR